MSDFDNSVTGHVRRSLATARRERDEARSQLASVTAALKREAALKDGARGAAIDLQTERDAARRERDEARCGRDAWIEAERQARADAYTKCAEHLTRVSAFGPESRSQMRGAASVFRAWAVMNPPSPAPPPTPPAGTPAPAVQGEPPRCREWCGKLARSHEHPIGDGEVFQTMDTPARTRCYCSAACRDAQRPTHPREGEPGRCDRCHGDGRLDTKVLMTIPGAPYVTGRDKDGRIICPACHGSGTCPPQVTPEGGKP